MPTTRSRRRARGAAATIEDATRELVGAYRLAEAELSAELARVTASIVDPDSTRRFRQAQIRALRTRVAVTRARLEGHASMFTEDTLSRIYTAGMQRARDALQLGGQPSFTTLHTRALEVLASDTFDDLAAATAYVDESARAAIRRATRARTMAGALEGTSVARDRAQLVDALRRDGVTGFVDASGRGWRLSTYAEMVVRTKSAQAYNTGTVLQAEETGTSVFVISDGTRSRHPECLAFDGTTCTGAWALSNPIQHPNCVRSFGPAPLHRGPVDHGDLERTADDPDAPDPVEAPTAGDDDGARTELPRHRREVDALRADLDRGALLDPIDPLVHMRADGAPAARVIAAGRQVRAMGKVADDELQRRVARRFGRDEHVPKLTRRSERLKRKTSRLSDRRYREQVKLDRQYGFQVGTRLADVDDPDRYREWVARRQALDASIDPELRELLDQRRAIVERLHTPGVDGTTLAGRWSIAEREELPGVLEELGVRMGGTPTVRPGRALPEMGARAGTADAVDAVQQAGRFYPSRWVDASNARDGIRVVESDRGFYNAANGYLSVSDVDPARDLARYGRGRFDRVAVHELGHRMEDVVPELRRLEWAYWHERGGKWIDRDAGIVRRVRPDDLVEMYRPGSGEFAAPDKWTETYTGKVYRDNPGALWEILTTGVEGVVYGRWDGHHTDPDLRRFIIGAMVAFG